MSCGSCESNIATTNGTAMHDRVKCIFIYSKLHTAKSPLSGPLNNEHLDPPSTGHYLWPHKINFLFLVSYTWWSGVCDTVCCLHAPSGFTPLPASLRMLSVYFLLIQPFTVLCNASILMSWIELPFSVPCFSSCPLYTLLWVLIYLIRSYLHLFTQ